MITFRKRLLRRALRKRYYEKLKLDKKLNSLKSEIRNTINGIEWYFLIEAKQKTLNTETFKLECHMKRSYLT